MLDEYQVKRFEHLQFGMDFFQFAALHCATALDAAVGPIGVGIDGDGKASSSSSSSSHGRNQPLADSGGVGGSGGDDDEQVLAAVADMRLNMLSFLQHRVGSGRCVWSFIASVYGLRVWFACMCVCGLCAECVYAYYGCVVSGKKYVIV